jgi:GMP synthase (glutamine-hydrolysing)
MSAVCILVTGRPVPSAERLRGGFADMVRSATGGAWSGAWIDLDATDDRPIPEHVEALVITGSPASVTERAPWMLRREAELAALVARDVPVLGVCFGHQLLAQALGGRVAKNPRGREIGTVALSAHVQNPLFEGAIDVNSSHVDAVIEPPPGAEIVASTERDPMSVLRFRRRAFGVQFHPEFDAEIVRCYLRERREPILSEGLDPDALEAQARDTPGGAAVLARFLRG